MIAVDTSPLMFPYFGAVVTPTTGIEAGFEARARCFM
jgi:hypothetical protein